MAGYETKLDIRIDAWLSFLCPKLYKNATEPFLKQLITRNEN